MRYKGTLELEKVFLITDLSFHMNNFNNNIYVHMLQKLLLMFLDPLDNNVEN